MEALETVKMETMTVSDGENGNQTNAEIQGEVAGFAETTESALPIALGFDMAALRLRLDWSIKQAKF